MSFELTDYVPPVIDLNSEVKRHCRVPVDYNGDNAMLERFLEGAINQVEGDAERILGYATCVVTANPDKIDCDGLSHFRWPVVPLLPATDGISVEYLNADDEWTEADVTVFVMPGEPAYVLFDAGSLALSSKSSLSKFRITAQVGYNSDPEADDYKPLPPNAIPTILMWVAESYTNREPIVYAKANAAFQRAYNARISSLRWRVYP